MKRVRCSGAWCYIAVSALVALLTMFPGAPSAQENVLWIKAVNDGGKAVTTASARCSVGGQPLTLNPVTADLNGEIRIRVPNPTRSMARCAISAPGYLATDVYLDFGGTLVRQEVTLNPMVTFAVQRGMLADRSHVIIEALIHNPTSQPVDIEAIGIDGTAKARTGCFDPRPAVVVKINPKFQLTSTAPISPNTVAASVILSSPQGTTIWESEMLAEGQLESLGCGQARVAIWAPTLIQLAPKERPKIQIQVPVRVTASKGEPDVELMLSEWDQLRVKIRLTSGTVLESTPR